MILAPGTRLGPYEIVAPLGAGGMGEVYRARDARLGRDVAIKALPTAFAQDPERLARFEREARLLATLQHPNIAGIHGLEEVAGQRYLVLEFVDGETLATRLQRGALPLDDALDVGRQIAAALESAHESGVVHRDLKPGNVMLTRAGGVKVLDFGLAKGAAGDPSASSPELSASPTMTHAATAAGVILGTAAYMSPEQARGKAVDRRTDIWSFGCVLYECLAGRPVFEGETVSDIIARILERDADFSALPERTPERVRALLRRCLEKDARRRLRDIGEARIELEDLHAARLSGASLAVAGAPAGPAVARGIQTHHALSLAIGAAIAAFALGLLARPVVDHPPAPPAVQFEVPSPAPFEIQKDAAQSALSPDGTMLAFVGRDSAQQSLWVRDLASLVARRLADTDGAQMPFWSPDGRSIGFFTETQLKRVPAAGGAVDVICDVKRARGGTWNRAGVIVFAPTSDGPLARVSASGGDPRPVTSLDASRHESGQRFPQFLPDGRHFLYASLPPHEGRFDICVGSLDGRERRRVAEGYTGAVYAPPGYLLYQRNGTIVAQAFDAGRRRVRGEPVSLRLAPEGSDYASAPGFSVSASGGLAFLTPHATTWRCAWLDRDGHELAPVGLPPGPYSDARLSPDGRRAALEVRPSPVECAIVVADLERGTLVHLSDDPGVSETPRWSPDGLRIAYQNSQYGSQHLVVRALDGSSPPRRYLEDDAAFKLLCAWSPDGQSLVYGRQDPLTRWDLYVLSLATGKPTPYLRTAANEANGEISPDGHWMLYRSDESGQSDVFVRAYPKPGGEIPVTSAGGTPVGWSASGKQVYFAESDKPQEAFQADVLPGPGFRLGPPRLLGRAPRGVNAVGLSPDGKRLLALVPVGEAPPPSITVVLGWHALLASH